MTTGRNRTEHETDSSQYLAALDYIERLIAERDQAVRLAFDQQQELEKILEQRGR